MKIVNVRDIEEVRFGKEGRLGFDKEISVALGRQPDSMDIMERHPFDVEILRVPAGATPYRYHSHSAQWEFYYVLSGSGTIRDEAGNTRTTAGDAFVFKPGEAHQLINDSDADWELMVIADNPIGESYHYPDEAMWIVNSPERRYVSLHPERESQK